MHCSTQSMRRVEKELYYIFLFNQPLIMMYLNKLIRLIWFFLFFVLFFTTQTDMQSALTRVTEFPSEVINEYTSVSKYDVTPA